MLLHWSTVLIFCTIFGAADGAPCSATTDMNTQIQHTSDGCTIMAPDYSPTGATVVTKMVTNTAELEPVLTDVLTANIKSGVTNTELLTGLCVRFLDITGKSYTDFASSPARIGPDLATNAGGAGSCDSTTTTPAPTTVSSGSSSGQSPNSIKSCFAADSTVETVNGRMNMSHLYQQYRTDEIQILTAEGQFSPVAFWLHAEPEKSAEFIRLTTANGQSISLTRGHLVFKTDCDRVERQTVRAAKIFPGDCLMVKSGNGHLQAHKVLKIDKFTSVGIYSPMTASGDILVDNILASCYSEVETVQIQSLVFGYVAILKRAAKLLLSDNIFSVVIGYDVNINPLGELWDQLATLSQHFIA